MLLFNLLSLKEHKSSINFLNNNYEQAGTTYDEYESPRGVKGARMYGSATFKDVQNPLGTSQKRAYEVYIFEEGIGI